MIVRPRGVEWENVSPYPIQGLPDLSRVSDRFSLLALKVEIGIFDRSQRWFCGLAQYMAPPWNSYRVSLYLSPDYPRNHVLYPESFGGERREIEIRTWEEDLHFLLFHGIYHILIESRIWHGKGWEEKRWDDSFRESGREIRCRHEHRADKFGIRALLSLRNTGV